MGPTVIIVVLVAICLIAVVITRRGPSKRTVTTDARPREPGAPRPPFAKIMLGIVIVVVLAIVLAPVVVYLSWVVSGVGQP